MKMLGLLNLSMQKLLKVVMVIGCIFLMSNLYGQNVAITDDDGYSPHSSAMLDVKSTTKGFLAPRLTTTEQNAISGPAAGLLIFNTTEGKYSYYTGSGWEFVGGNLTFGNGLTNSSGNIELGGNLSKTTTISQGSYDFNFDLNGTGDFYIKDGGSSVFSINSDGDAVFGGTVQLGNNIIAGQSDGTFKTYKNLASYYASGNNQGAIVIKTKQPWNSNMFVMKILGYTHGTLEGPLELVISGYTYSTSSAYNLGYINNSSYDIRVRVMRDASGNRVIVLGEETGYFNYGTIYVTDYMQMFSGVSDTYAEGWTIERSINLAGDGYSYAQEATDMTSIGGYSVSDLDNQLVFDLNSNNITPKSSSYRLGLGSTSGSSRLVVKGNTSAAVNDPLFAVLNNSNDTVFAVYNEGVRIWVDDNAQKATGNRGGFAVGGFSSSKGTVTNEFLRVTPDSVRVYFDADAAKATGNRGGFAVGGFSSSKADPVDLMRLQVENYFIGHKSGLKTTGTGNIFLGYQSGLDNTIGTYNTFIGYYSGWNNINGNFNVFIGNQTALYNTSGSSNTYLGVFTGLNNSTGSYNVFLGNYAGYDNTSGSRNVYIGNYAAANSESGYDNVFIGNNAGYNNAGTDNVFIGKTAGNSNSSGNYNTFVGSETGVDNTTGVYNTFIGYQAGHENSTAGYNTFVGYHSGYYNTTAQSQAFFGYKAGYQSTGNGNTFLGAEAGYLTSTGIENVYVGMGAGRECTGSHNVFIGRGAGMSESGDHQLIIENSVSWNNDYETLALVYGNFDTDMLRFNANVGIGYPAYSSYGLVVKGGSTNSLRVYSDGQTYTMYVGGNSQIAGTWSTTSDIRYKENINSLGKVSNELVKLNPVSFNWKKDFVEEFGNDTSMQIGLIAQEVEKIFPLIVTTDEEGFKSIQYSKLNVYLLQAFKEQQQQIEELKAQIADKENELEEAKALNNRMNELEKQIDELNKILNFKTSK